MMNSKRAIIKQVKSAHRDNLRSNLLHRLEAARNQGNDSLIKQLEAEARYLDIQP
jgi:hypothetical protein